MRRLHPGLHPSIVIGGSAFRVCYAETNSPTTAGGGPDSCRGRFCRSGGRALAWPLLRRTALPDLPCRPRRSPATRGADGDPDARCRGEICGRRKPEVSSRPRLQPSEFPALPLSNLNFPSIVFPHALTANSRRMPFFTFIRAASARRRRGPQFIMGESIDEIREGISWDTVSLLRNIYSCTRWLRSDRKFEQCQRHRNRPFGGCCRWRNSYRPRSCQRLRAIRHNRQFRQFQLPERAVQSLSPVRYGARDSALTRRTLTSAPPCLSR